MVIFIEKMFYSKFNYYFLMILILSDNSQHIKLLKKKSTYLHNDVLFCCKNIEWCMLIFYITTTML